MPMIAKGMTSMLKLSDRSTSDERFSDLTKVYTEAYLDNEPNNIQLPDIKSILECFLWTKMQHSLRKRGLSHKISCLNIGESYLKSRKRQCRNTGRENLNPVEDSCPNEPDQWNQEWRFDSDEDEDELLTEEGETTKDLDHIFQNEYYSGEISLLDDTCDGGHMYPDCFPSIEQHRHCGNNGDRSKAPVVTSFHPSQDTTPLSPRIPCSLKDTAMGILDFSSSPLPLDDNGNTELVTDQLTIFNTSSTTSKPPTLFGSSSPITNQCIDESYASLDQEDGVEMLL